MTRRLHLATYYVLAFAFAAQLADLLTTLNPQPGAVEGNPAMVGAVAMPLLFVVVKLIVMPGLFVAAVWVCGELGHLATVICLSTLTVGALFIFTVAAHNLTL